MKVSKRLWYYIVVIGFPLFFVLHGVNEQFGLIRAQIIARLLLIYFSVAIIVAITAKLIMKSYERATLLTFFILCAYFFFGAVKDLLKNSFFDSVGSYKYFLTGTIILILLVVFLVKKIKSPLTRANRFIRLLIVLCIGLEAGLLFYNVLTKKYLQKDPGDIHHELIKNINVPDTVQKPTIVWIVMDEYSGNTGLLKKWNFVNPFGATLRKKGFFVADTAWSPYNYTHYSLVSTLDMSYLRGLENHSVIGYRDIVRGNRSLEETNVVKLLESAGYDIYNYTIYNIKNHPTAAHEYFVNADFKLVDNQTLPGRIKQDIGWNFRNFFSRNRKAADSADLAKSILAEAKYRRDLVDESAGVVALAAQKGKPAFLMFHYMITHEPFIYRPDGSLDLSSGFGMYPDRYVPSIERANEALSGLIDSIQAAYKGKNLVIILQGDHGYKFDESDPLFEQEGCSIFYAVYCSDLQYPDWKNPFNAANGFRVLFNKYFQTNLPVLENRSFNLFYR
ncbi:MAG: sulfatase-like hydrolase/transferase [Chitinophagaceae bacterium]|nr:sulfatase-like hydrolase/transferase [Chitinophagaceae bacterium]